MAAHASTMSSSQIKNAIPSSYSSREVLAFERNPRDHYDTDIQTPHKSVLSLTSSRKGAVDSPTPSHASYASTTTPSLLFSHVHTVNSSISSDPSHWHGTSECLVAPSPVALNREPLTFSKPHSPSPNATPTPSRMPTPLARTRPEPHPSPLPSQSLSSRVPAQQYSLPKHTSVSSVASIDSTYPQPYSFCQAISFPHPRLVQVPMGSPNPKQQSPSNSRPYRSFAADDLSLNGVKRMNVQIQRERDQWSHFRIGSGSRNKVLNCDVDGYLSEGDLLTSPRRRVRSEMPTGLDRLEQERMDQRRGYNSLDSPRSRRIVAPLEVPQTPTVANCSGWFSNLVHKSRPGLDNSHDEIARVQAIRSKPMQRDVNAYGRAFARSISQETLEIRLQPPSPSIEHVLGEAISPEVPSDSRRALISSQFESQLVTLPPHLRQATASTFSSTNVSNFDAAQAQPLTSGIRLSPSLPLLNAIRSGQNWHSRPRTNSQNSARPSLKEIACLNLELYNLLVAEQAVATPPPSPKTKPIRHRSMYQHRITAAEHARTGSDPPTQPLPPIPLSGATTTDVTLRKVSAGSTTVPESPMDKEMSQMRLFLRPQPSPGRSDVFGSDGTSILDLTEDEDEFNRNLFFRPPPTWQRSSASTVSSENGTPHTPPQSLTEEILLRNHPFAFAPDRDSTVTVKPFGNRFETPTSTLPFLAGLGISEPTHHGIDTSFDERAEASSIARSESWRTADDGGDDSDLITPEQFLAENHGFSTEAELDDSEFITPEQFLTENHVFSTESELGDFYSDRMHSDRDSEQSHRSFLDFDDEDEAPEEISFIDFSVTPVIATHSFSALHSNTQGTIFGLQGLTQVFPSRPEQFANRIRHGRAI